MGGVDASGWLTAFQGHAEQAVSDLLWNRFYFGPLNHTERDQLLATWLEAFGSSEEFAPRLDAALTAWLEENWGRFNPPATTMVSAWTCLASVVEFSARLPQARLVRTAESLRGRFPLRERFLGSLSTAPAADPLGFYLAAVAEFQGDDRSLAGFWQQLCDLPDGVPFYHARYAILGLRRLKATNSWENGSLRTEVVLGLLRLAAAFDRLVRERELAEPLAKSTFRRVAIQLAAAYPDSRRWSEHGLAPVLEMPDRPRKWVLETVPSLATAVRQELARANRPHTRPRRSIQPDPTWADRAKALATELRHGHASSLVDIERLLDEQRRYSEATGDTYFVVRSLCNFASRILRFRPDIAGRWAEEARRLAPNDPFNWSTVREVHLTHKDFTRALCFAWVAWKRFPQDAVTHAGLAQALKVAGRYAEAEEVYRQTIECFPEEVIPRNGLAEVLKAAGRYPEAEAMYRLIIQLAPAQVDQHSQAFARAGLADTLRRARRWEDAEIAYRENIAAGYANSATFVGLAYVLLRKGEPGRAEALSLADEALKSDHGNPYALGLKLKLQPDQAADLTAIAAEWDYFADRLLKDEAASENMVQGGEFDQIETASTLPSKTDPAAAETIVPKTPDPHDAPAKSSAPEPDDQGQTLPSMMDALSLESAFGPPAEPAALPEPVKPVSRPPEMDLIALAALVAEASFYRAWAVRSSGEAATSRREKALALLSEAGKMLPDDAQVQAEKAAVISATGDLALAEATLATQLENHPAAASLLVLKARLDREAARREERRLSEESLAGLLQAPNRLRNIDPALMPVFHFEKGLAALALLDGAARIDTAAAAFTDFRRTVARRAAAEKLDRESSRDIRAKEVPRFHEWLQSTANRRFFNLLPDPEAVRANDMPGIERALTNHPNAFDEIEDVMVDRIAYAGV